MPCADSRVDLDKYEMMDGLNKVTRLLCEIMPQVIESDVSVSVELMQWWEKHKKADEERESR